MVAAMLCAGHSVDKIEQLMYGLDFQKFEDNCNPLRIATHYGLYSGDYILDFARQILLQSPLGLNADTSFIELRNAGCKDLFIFAANLNDFSLTEFSADKTPYANVAEAIRASMSIPLFFKAWKFSDSYPSDHLYVDGGVIFNYPLTFFDNTRFCTGSECLNTESLGLYLYSSQVACKRELGFNQIMHYTRHLFETMLNSQDVDFEADGAQMRRSVMIDDLGIMSTNFHLTKEDMSNLIASGRKGAQLYFKSNPILTNTVVTNLS
jgi:NTE family protein